MDDSSGFELGNTARRALTNSPIYDLRNLQVDVRDGALMISGTVSSFYYKQMAQEAIWDVCGHDTFDLVNEIQVRHSSQQAVMV